MMRDMCTHAASRWLQSLVPNPLLQVAAVSRCSATAVAAIVATPVRAHFFGLTLVQPVGDAVHGAGVCVRVCVCLRVFVCVCVFDVVPVAGAAAAPGLIQGKSRVKPVAGCPFCSHAAAQGPSATARHRLRLLLWVKVTRHMSYVT